MEQKRRTNAYLQSTEELWGDECESLKRKTEAAQFHAEEAVLPSKKHHLVRYLETSRFHSELLQKQNSVRKGSLALK